MQEQGLYHIQTVSERTGISLYNLRAWEKRYGFPLPKRSPGGHRLYDENDIQALLWIKTRMEQDHLKISEAIRLYRMHQEKLSQTPDEKGVEPQTIAAYALLEHTPLSEESRVLYAALKTFHFRRSHQLLDEGLERYDLETIVFQWLVPILKQMEKDIEEGSLTPAEKKVITEVLLGRLYRLNALYDRDLDFPPDAIAFAPSGESEHIGLFAITILLRKNGFSILYLGPDTSDEAIYSALERLMPKSVLATAHHKKSLDKIIALYEEQPKLHPKPPWFVGGKYAHVLYERNDLKYMFPFERNRISFERLVKHMEQIRHQNL